MNDETIIRYLNGDLNPVETREFLEWSKLDSSNYEQLKRIHQSWVLSSIVESDFNADFEKEFQLFQFHRLRKLSELKKNQQIKILRWVAGVAAAIIILLGGYLIVSKQLNNDLNYLADAQNTVITLAGEKTKIILADGSVIWVNACTSLKYPANMIGSKIHFFLDGEAFFDFKKLKGRKIIVHTSQINVNVLGTAFNLRSYSDENIIETTLVRGIVEIEKNATKANKFNEKVRLEPNQSATYIKNLNSTSIKTLTEGLGEKTNSLEEVITSAKLKKANMIVSENANLDLKVSWKEGKLNFRGESFLNLAKIFERWYDVKIVINGEKLKKTIFTGTFEKETIVQALEALSYPVPFHYSVKKDSIFITEKKMSN